MFESFVRINVSVNPFSRGKPDQPHNSCLTILSIEIRRHSVEGFGWLAVYAQPVSIISLPALYSLISVPISVWVYTYLLELQMFNLIYRAGCRDVVMYR